MDMTVTCKTEEVIKRLSANREKHAGLVKEAREGYIEHAKAALATKLDKLKMGKCISVAVQLVLPQDHTGEYDTVLGMLRAHTDATVVLTYKEFRQFMEDKWDWWGGFTASNSRYSSSTRALVEDE